MVFDFKKKIGDEKREKENKKRPQSDLGLKGARFTINRLYQS